MDFPDLIDAGSPQILEDALANLPAGSPHEIAASVGALQLLPANAHRIPRFEVAAAIAASLPRGASSFSSLRARDLRKWLDGPPFTTPPLVFQEDAFTDPFTEAFAFHGGSFIVFPGILDDATFILRHLCEALFLGPIEVLNERAAQHAAALVTAVLVISDTMAKRARLARGHPTPARSGNTVVVPSVRELRQLGRAVSFTKRELNELLGPVGLSVNALAPFILDQGSLDLRDTDPLSAETISRPILWTGRRFVIVAPLNLMAALRHALLNLVDDQDRRAELSQAYRWVVFRTVVHSLRLFGLKPIPIPLPPMPQLPGQAQVFTLDTDKVVHVLLVSDDLSRYDPGDAFGVWPVQHLASTIESWLPTIEREVFTNLTPCPNEILHVILMQGLGRASSLGTQGRMDPVRSEQLILSASDLEVIAYLEHSNPLLLWQYAQAHDRLRDQCEALAVERLAEFDFFRSNGYTYYSSDKETPKLFVFSQEGKGALRQSVIDKFDFHSLEEPDDGTIVELVSDDGSRSIPIYWPMPKPRINPPLMSVVEALALPIWITAADHDSDSEYRNIYFRFVECFAYWIWQVSPALVAIAHSLSTYLDRVVIRINVPGSDDWFCEPHASMKDINFIECTCTSYDEINVILRPGMNAQLARADNRGERALVRAFLRSFGELACRTTGEQNSLCIESNVDHTLDLFVPLGPKKKLLLLDGATNPSIDRRFLPGFRKVQDVEIQRLLDNIGQFSQSELALATGPIPKSDRTRFLRSIVAYLFDELEKLVATISPDRLLEWLVAHDESIIAEEDFLRLTVPTRIACYGSASEMAHKLESEIPEKTSASIASRFLIEYVTARPPHGLRPMSLSVYDRLMAIALQIHKLGVISDSIHYGLSDRKIAMLRSGRIAIASGKYENACDEYFSEYVVGAVSDAEDAFPRHWREKRADATVSGTAPIDDAQQEATKAEFGIALGDLLSFLLEMQVHGSRMSGDPKVMEVSILVDRVATSLGWPVPKVRNAFEFFAARPRDRFLDPPKPFETEDVYPWRFNRRLSYYRKPLLIRASSDSEELIWGARHVDQSARYLIDLCDGGRLRAKSHAMKRILAEHRQFYAEEFNDKVADLFASQPEFIVRRRVKKIGSQLVARKNGQPLGDVDVLVIIPEERRCIAIEVKKLAGARTPPELALELRSLFGPRSDGKYALRRLEERVGWLRTHFREVLDWLNISTDHSEEWSIKGMIVLDKELIAPFVARPEIEVLSYRRVKDRIESQSTINRGSRATIPESQV